MSSAAPQKKPKTDRNKRRSRVLGKKIREGYARSGMTQQDFADKIGVTTEAVRNWEQGAQPTLKNYYAICELLRIDPDTQEFVNQATSRPNRSVDELPSGPRAGPSHSVPVYAMPVPKSELRLVEAANSIGNIRARVADTYFVLLDVSEMSPTLRRGVCIPVRPVSGTLEDVASTAVYIYRIGSSSQIRRLVWKDDDHVEAIADNPRYPTITFTVSSKPDFELLGRVDLDV